MLSSGWRVAEACALDVASVDFGTATVEAINIRVKGTQREIRALRN